MDAQQQLFGLMAVAEEHQKAVQAALEALAAERAALAKERARLEATLVEQALAVQTAADSVSTVAASIKYAGAEAVVGIKRAAGEAVGDSIRENIGMVADATQKSLNGASRPIVESFSDVVRAAGAAEGKLNRAVNAFGWRLAMLAGGAAAGSSVAVLIAAWLAVLWERHEIEKLAVEKAQLAGQVEELRLNAEELAKRSSGKGSRAR